MVADNYFSAESVIRWRGFCAGVGKGKEQVKIEIMLHLQIQYERVKYEGKAVLPGENYTKVF